MNGALASAPTIRLPFTMKLVTATNTIWPHVSTCSVPPSATVTCGTPEKDVLSPPIFSVPFFTVIVPVVEWVVVTPA